jgi:hypothetical protein
MINEKFNFFVKKLTLAWETDSLSPKSGVKLGNYFLGESPNTIYIFKYNKDNLMARLDEERCWIDDRTLYELLKKILPEYLEYFTGRVNFTSGKWPVGEDE